MSKVCALCGKGRTAGKNVSHSNRHTVRSFSANVHKMKLSVDGQVKSVYVCTRCKRTLNKED
ncbi:MAG TPA: 50S ribosomal protein L28 [Firmicutes bacterium]|nr:50S ribosomal protein L28 [Bacillota bacterium]